MKCAIHYTDPSLAAAAEQLASTLHLPMITTLDLNYCAILQYTPNHLQLLLTTEPTLKPIYVDFLAGPVAYRQQHGSGRSEALARAVGVKGAYRPSVLDTTAGLGRDGFLLAALGCKVQLLERSPVIAALLADGLTRAKTDPYWHTHLQLELAVIDAHHYLKTLTEKPDVIYLDPMFPERKHTALVKKEMRILRHIVGDDDDVVPLFELALTHAQTRVVVKRHSVDPWINTLKPSYQLVGKSNRFDVYLT